MVRTLKCPNAQAHKGQNAQNAQTPKRSNAQTPKRANAQTPKRFLSGKSGWLQHFCRVRLRGHQDVGFRRTTNLHRGGIELRGLDEVQEEVGQALPQPGHGRRFATPIEEVGLPLQELNDVLGEAAVELGHRPFDAEQCVQALLDAVEWRDQSLVQVHELPRANGEGRVDVHDMAVAAFPLLRRGHGLQDLGDSHVASLLAGLLAHAPDALQQSGFLLQQLLVRTALVLRTAPKVARGDLLRLLQPPRLKFVVQHLKVALLAGVQASVDLPLMPGLLLPLQLVQLFQLRALRLLNGLPLAEGQAAREVASPAPLHHDGGASLHLQELVGAEVRARDQHLISAGVHMQVHPLHLRAALSVRLLPAGHRLVGLGVPLPLVAHVLHHSLVGFRLRGRVQQHHATPLVAEPPQRRLAEAGGQLLHGHAHGLAPIGVQGDVQHRRHDVVGVAVGRPERRLLRQGRLLGFGLRLRRSHARGHWRSGGRDGPNVGPSVASSSFLGGFERKSEHQLIAGFGLWLCWSCITASESGERDQAIRRQLERGVRAEVQELLWRDSFKILWVSLCWRTLLAAT
eukprot:scaffold5102_cov267-Pinguiococcus_pyrenoidosus.AAC.2